MKLSPFLPPVLLLSITALLAGLWAGLLRLGWQIPGDLAAFAYTHGPLMISGFLGSLISVERVVALRQRWMFAAPLLTGPGWLLTVLLPAQPVGPLAMTLGSLGTFVILSVMVRREPVLHTLTMAAGALCWLVGNLLWLSGAEIFRVVYWWAAFLVLTITGERLELSRVLRMTARKQLLFLLAAGLFALGVIITLFDLAWGARLAGAGLLALSAWLIAFDIARRNIRHPVPLTRYIARCLFLGYFWLALGGGLWLFNSNASLYAGPLYDAGLHSVFVGFVISMIFGHAPIILPALLNRMLPYHPVFYASLGLLHLSLLLRVGADLARQMDLRRWGGLLNEVAILLFFASLIITLVRQNRAARKAGA
ncbi:MAG TPA: hypothetical protein VIO36_04550 [Anaerolineaceae bacterium]